MRARHVCRNAALAAAALVLASGAFAQTAQEKDAQRRIHDLCVEKLGPGAEPIRAMVTGDKAILAGQVASRPVRHLAEQVALAVPGIRDVDNEITLAKTLPLTGKVEDEARDVKLEIEVKSRLTSQVGTSPAHAIEVEAVDGWVSLRGTLPDQTRKDLAIDATRQVEGVNRVIDLIDVAPR